MKLSTESKMYSNVPQKHFQTYLTPLLGAGVLCINASGFLVELHIVFNRICCFFVELLNLEYYDTWKFANLFRFSKVFKTHIPLYNMFSRKKYFFSFFWNVDEGLPNLIEALLFEICGSACKPLRLWQQIMRASQLTIKIS